MKFFLAFNLLIFSLFSCTEEKRAHADIDTWNVTYSQFREKAKEALTFCKSKNMDTNYCVLVDMGVHSGKYRLVLWDFKKDTFVYRMLVGHGCGANPWGEDDSKQKPSFSNVDGSHLSSLGKYKIGQRGHSDWGIGVKYLLHGLDSTNSNALARYVVLHGWDKMSEDEIYPEGSPEGWGCPTVSNSDMRRLDSVLTSLSGNVLLWMYN